MPNGVAFSLISVVLNEPNAFDATVPHDIGRVISRSVVDDDNFKRKRRLLDERIDFLDRIANPAGFVERGNNDGDNRLLIVNGHCGTASAQALPCLHKGAYCIIRSGNSDGTKGSSPGSRIPFSAL